MPRASGDAASNDVAPGDDSELPHTGGAAGWEALIGALVIGLGTALASLRRRPDYLES